MTQTPLHLRGKVKPPRRANVRGRGYHRVIGSSVGKRIGKFGRDYAPSWCQRAVFVGDDGEETEDICCAYCGDRYTDVEHIVPWSWLSKVSALDDAAVWTWLVPSCSECNGIASDQMFPTPFAKRKYIQERLRARYSMELSGGEWADDEIDELGPRLGQFVRAKQAQVENLRLRISYTGPLPLTLGSKTLGTIVRAREDSGISPESANCKRPVAS